MKRGEPTFFQNVLPHHTRRTDGKEDAAAVIIVRPYIEEMMMRNGNTKIDLGQMTEWL